MRSFVHSDPSAEEARIIIDLDGGNDEPVKGFLKQVNDTTFYGYRFSKGWAPDQQEYIAVVVSKPVQEFQIYDNRKKLKGTEESGERIKGFLEFSTEKDEQVLLKIGVSPVSMNNAMANLQAEIPDWDFDNVYVAANEKWNRELFTDAKVTGLGNLEITPEFAAKLGAAYGAMLGAGSSVVYSRDVSLSFGKFLS